MAAISLSSLSTRELMAMYPDAVREARREENRKADRMVITLLILQWIGLIAVALTMTPRTWIGATSAVHTHVLFAFGLGGLAVAPAILMAWRRGGRRWTRLTISASQGIMSALLIHFMGGRIEAHFGVFVFMAAMIAYRDWKVFIPAAVITIADHLLRGMFWPMSVYGVETANLLVTMEHAFWVAINVAFLSAYAVRFDWGLAKGVVRRERESDRARALAKEVESIRGQLDRMLDEHDLSQDLTVGGHATLNELSVGINQFLDEMRTMVEAVGEAANTSGVASEQLAAAASELNSSVESVENTLSTVTETVESSVSRAAEAGGAIEEGVQDLSAMSSKVESGAQRVRELDQLTEPIQGAITMINEISDQTNLLALNAAIEAARAGEHGRGFAVVADEVRKLAESTIAATGEVSSSVNSITEQSGKAVKQMTETLSQTKATAERGATDAARMQTIVTDARAMGSGIAEVAVSMDEMRSVTASVSKAAENLSSQVSKMRDVAGRFRV